MLVTGGNRGIGRAIAEAFVAQGDRVAVTTRTGGAPEGRLDVRCDITDPAAVEAAFARGRGARTARSRCWSPTPASPPTRCCCGCRTTTGRRSSTPTSPARSGSPSARLQGHAAAAPRPDHLHLLGGRAARLGRPGQLRRLQGRPGRHGPLDRPRARLARSITANVVAPGFVETDMTDDPERRAEGASTRRRCRSAGTRSTDEIAATVTWLASDGAAYVTGAVIPVDGGLGMGH